MQVFLQYFKMKNPSLWLVVICLLTCWVKCLASCITLSEEVDALYSLYQSTDGRQWQWKANQTLYGIPWNFTITTTGEVSVGCDPCQTHWQGITCTSDSTGVTDSSCSIVSLTLSNYSLSGILPLALVNLTQLLTVDLSYNPGLGSGNNITDLSPYFTSWTQLQSLNLSYCSLLSTVPISITTLLNLTTINLSFNRVIGTIPYNLTALPVLEYLNLQTNALHGTIPSPIALVTPYSLLSYLDLSDNHLNGSIPSDLGYLQMVRYYNISFNQLSSTIPQSLGTINTNQYFFQVLDIQYNELSGSLPSTTGDLYFLRILRINNNQLSSSLPISLHQLQYLEVLTAQNNQFTGPIPNTLLSGLRSIVILLLSNNHFTGPFPGDGINTLHYLYDFYIDNNHLSSTLCPSLFNGAIGDYWIYQNQFDGTLPNAYNVSYLQLIYAYSNQLTSTLPDWTHITNLYEVDVHNNYLSHTIPTYLFNTEYCTSLYLFYLQDNLFTGLLPSFANCPLMEYVRIDNNMLTGSIVDSFTNLPILNVFNASNNMITGSFPTTLRFTAMESLDLSNNRLTGSIAFPATTSPHYTTNPKGLVFYHLTQLFLQRNSFIGSLDFLMNCTIPTTMPSYSPTGLPTSVPTRVQHISLTTNYTTLIPLSVIDVSDNSFSSTIPIGLFTNSYQLQVFAAVKNCLTGSLSVLLCGQSGMSMDTLLLLALDGLHTSPTCQQRLFPGIPASHSYVLDSYITGSIPQCLFTDMPVLQTLHVSGNGIKGSLPSNLTILSPLLSDLSLSHNRLTGSIPVIIQSRNWVNLDLSFNMFTGEVNTDILSLQYDNSSNASSLSLQMNRLSGKVPSSLHSLTSVNVLEGNLYTCDTGVTRSNQLPIHDPNYDSYQCGSNAFNDAVYLWLGGLIVMIGIYMIGMECSSNVLIKMLRMLWSAVLGESEQSTEQSTSGWIWIDELLVCFHFLRCFSMTVCVVCVLVLIPLYIGLSEEYTVYTHTYAYMVSFAYDSGVVPAIVMFVVLGMILVLVFSKIWAKLLLDSMRGRERDNRDRETRWGERVILYLTTLNLHCLWRRLRDIDRVRDRENRVSLSSTTSSSSNHVLYIVIVCSFVLNVLIVMTVNMAYVDAMTVSSLSHTVKTVITIAVSLFKLLWTPIFRVCFTSTLEYFTGTGNVRGTHSNANNGTPSGAAYQWSGKFMLSYLLFISLFNNILVPCIAIALISSNCFLYAIIPSPTVTTTFSLLECLYSIFQYTEEGIECGLYTTVSYETSYKPPYSYTYQCSSSLLTSFSSLFVYRFVIGRILLPMMELHVIKPLQQYYLQRGIKHYCVNVCTIMLPVIYRPVLTTDDGRVHGVEEEEREKEVRCEDIYPCHQHIVSFVTDIAIMLSFGLIFPLLCLVGMGSLWVYTWYMEVVISELMRLVNVCRDKSVEGGTGLIKILDNTNASCKYCLKLLVISIQSLLVIVAMFWSLFLFDTLGASHGVIDAIWMCVGFICISLIISVRNKYIVLDDDSNDKRKSDDTTNRKEIEMQVSVDRRTLDNTNYYPNLISNPMY